MGELKFIPMIDNLPQRVRQDDPAGGVLRPWVRKLPLRFQGVLLTAIRGCDGSPKEDDAKQLNRMVRRAVLNPHAERETALAGGFFGFDPAKLRSSLRDFLHSLDQYPLHYVMHLMHACEVIGYCHPEDEYRFFFADVYDKMCYMLHVNRETGLQMRARLCKDRIADGTTERDF